MKTRVKNVKLHKRKCAMRENYAYDIHLIQGHKLSTRIRGIIIHTPHSGLEHIMQTRGFHHFRIIYMHVTSNQLNAQLIHLYVQFVSFKDHNFNSPNWQEFFSEPRTQQNAVFSL